MSSSSSSFPSGSATTAHSPISIWKRFDHDTTARGDEPLHRSPDVLDEQIDPRTLPLGLQHELGVGVGQTHPHLIGTPPDHLVSQALVERNAGLEIADRKLQAIELAEERPTHGGRRPFNTARKWFSNASASAATPRRIRAPRGSTTVRPASSPLCTTVSLVRS